MPPYGLYRIIYFQADFITNLSEEIEMRPSFQFIHHGDVGDAYAGLVHAYMGGAKVVFSRKGLDLMLAYTAIDGQKGIVNPWGGFPGFTIGIVMDNNRARERTCLGGTSYDFSRIGLKGFGVNMTYTKSAIKKRSLLCSG